jgi:hypothetical protein
MAEDAMNKTTHLGVGHVVVIGVEIGIAKDSLSGLAGSAHITFRDPALWYV